MKCDCYKEGENQTVLQGVNGKKVKTAEFKQVAFVGIKMKATPYTEISVLFEGAKKPKLIPFFFNYCPFCGKKL